MFLAPHRTRLEPLALAALFVAGLAGLVASVLSVELLPLGDSFQHLLGSVARVHVDEEARGYGAYVTANAPATALGFAVVFEPLESLLGWSAAYRFTLVVLLVAWALAVLAVMASVRRERRFLALLGLATAAQWTFYLGFLNFFFALSLGVAFLALATRWRELRPVQVLALAALLFTVAVLHTAAAMLCGVAWALVVVVEHGKALRLPVLARVAAVGIPAALVAVFTTGAGAGLDDTLSWLPLLERVKLGARFTPGPLWQQWLPWLCVAPALVSLVHGDRADRARAFVGALLVVSSLVLPYHVAGWYFAGPRVLPVAFVLLLSAIPVERFGRKAYALALVTTLTALLCVVTTYMTHQKIERDTADAFIALHHEGLSPGMRLPIILDVKGHPEGAPVPIPDFAPVAFLGQLYAVTQGGWAAYSQDGLPEVHLVLRRPELYRYFPFPPDFEEWEATAASEGEQRRKRLGSLERQALAFDSVLLYGQPEDVSFFIERGWRADVAKGGLLLARPPLDARRRVP